jgi:hypothetical protein
LLTTFQILFKLVLNILVVCTLFIFNQSFWLLRKLRMNCKPCHFKYRYPIKITFHLGPCGMNFFLDFRKIEVTSQPLNVRVGQLVPECYSWTINMMLDWSFTMDKSTKVHLHVIIQVCLHGIIPSPHKVWGSK